MLGERKVPIHERDAPVVDKLLELRRGGRARGALEVGELDPREEDRHRDSDGAERGKDGSRLQPEHSRRVRRAPCDPRRSKVEGDAEERHRNAERIDEGTRSYRVAAEAECPDRTASVADAY